VRKNRSQAPPDKNSHVFKAAKALGISRDNLRYRVKKYGIEKPMD
jgi:transcriptional regulator with GAF, ATPase, and Fis domain